MTKTIERKVATLNAIVVAVREWQRGAISHREMNFRIGNHLTADQIARLNGRLYRTLGEASLAGMVAEILGL